jgi:XTP/dITP diphosphohydrolase
MPRGRVVLATRSAGKLRELGPLLAAAGWDAVTLATQGIPESPEEDGLEVHDTFEANALAKARWFFARGGGLPVVADDSGLCVDALDGRPGVHSKRWSGRPDLSGAALDAANNATLQAALEGESTRRAHYVCVIAWVGPTGEHVSRGETHGTMLAAPRGSGGFGYDPYFLSDDLGMTFAEATREAKAMVSHRGRALAALLASGKIDSPNRVTRDA